MVVPDGYGGGQAGSPRGGGLAGSAQNLGRVGSGVQGGVAGQGTVRGGGGVTGQPMVEFVVQYPPTPVEELDARDGHTERGHLLGRAGGVVGPPSVGVQQYAVRPGVGQNEKPSTVSGVSGVQGEVADAAVAGADLARRLLGGVPGVGAPRRGAGAQRSAPGQQGAGGVTGRDGDGVVESDGYFGEGGGGADERVGQ